MMHTMYAAASVYVLFGFAANVGAFTCRSVGSIQHHNTCRHSLRPLVGVVSRLSVGSRRNHVPVLLVAAASSSRTEEQEQEEVSSSELNQPKFLADLDQSSRQMLDELTITTSSQSQQCSIQWKFQGHDINCRVNRPGPGVGVVDNGVVDTNSPTTSSSSTKPVIVLVHGFGCSLVYWRETVQSLTRAGYTVYSMDLLGHGRSAKPTENVTYSTKLWARQLDDFCRDNLSSRDEEEDNIVLIGNSMGSIIALHAATGEFANESSSSSSSPAAAAGRGRPPRPYIREHIAGIGMFNCGIGMNIHSITRDEKWNPLQRYALDAIFTFLENTVFGNVALMEWILDKVVTRDFLRKTLLQLYQNAENPEATVDNELVESLYEPAKDPNSAQVLSQILTNEAGMTPMEVHAKYGPFLDDLPIHVVWGAADTVTPVDGIGEVGQLYSALGAADDNKVTMDLVQAGHIAFDEAPDVANGSMLGWLSSLVPA